MLRGRNIRLAHKMWIGIMETSEEYANPVLRELEKSAWERAAVEKYLEKIEDDCS